MATKLLQHAEEGSVDGLRECITGGIVDVDHVGREGSTALHVVAAAGHVDCVRLLVSAGANVDYKNTSGQSPLHLALAGRHCSVAILLLHSGADVDLPNDLGDTPIHLACREGLLNVAQTLCAFGCLVDVPNSQGLYPLHLAAKNGHIDVTRCLCLAGCNVEQRNSKGIKPEITAFKQGNYAISDLLNKLRVTCHRENFLGQLIPSDKPLSKLIVKVVGHPGAGKSTLVNAIKAGYFASLFSSSKSSSSSSYPPGKSCPPTPTETQIEMDVTSSRQTWATESQHYHYTRGIELHQTAVASGEVTLWDFSGLDTYHQIYDFFLADTWCFYMVVFNLKESPCTQHYHCSYWLHFLLTRLHSSHDSCGKPRLRVLLVGTHADASRTHRDAQGFYVSTATQELCHRLMAEFPAVKLESRVILCDAHLPNSQGIRDIKTVISTNKVAILQGDSLLWTNNKDKYHLLNHTWDTGLREQNVLKSSGFLESVLLCLPVWRKELETFPVIPWSTLLDRIHETVNPLAGHEHMSELVLQLTIMGEVLCLKSGAENLIVLDVPWLCGEVIGRLLSLESIARARLTGCYTEHDFQGAFPQGPADKTLCLLTALQLCTQCENDGDVEYELPCYNLVEKLEGLWAAVDERYSPSNSCYGGVRLKASYRVLQTIFTRLQVQLRRSTNLCGDPDSDLYQWFRGSKLCSGDMEAIITLEQDGQVVDIKVRGTHVLRLACFYFMEEILSIIDQVLATITPGVCYERHVLSVEQLRLHDEAPHSWRPEHVLATLLSPQGFSACLHNPKIGQDESLLQLVAFGADAVPAAVVLGGDLSVAELPPVCLRSLARLLDPPDPLGKDWCLVAVKLGLSHKIAYLDGVITQSKTLALLDIWIKHKGSTIGNFIKKLVEFGRQDAAEVVLQSAPLFRVIATPSYDMVNISR